MLNRIQKNDLTPRGISLLESLVVLGIIAILIALLLPAIQNARESARRVQCMNNLHQLGIAISNYSARESVFPQSLGRTSIFTRLLPELEQSVIYNSVNFSTNKLRGLNDILDEISANLTVSKTILSTFLCPSETPLGPYGNSSYAFNVGTGFQQFGSNGIFPKVGQGTVAPADVVDGLSNTVAMSEWVIAKPRLRDPRATIFSTSPLLVKPQEFDQFVSACSNLNPSIAAISSNSKGESWLKGDLGETLYNHVIPPNGHSCANAGMVQYGAYTAGSIHAAGCYALFADGHAIYVKQTVTPALWRALGSRNGGEVVDSRF